MMSTPKSYLCQTCLSQLPAAKLRGSITRSVPSFSHRLYSNRSTDGTNLRVPPAAGFAHLPSRRLISLSGPHAAHYLQGVITANISETNPPTTGFFAAFLNATGRVLNDVFIYPDPNWGGEGWLLEVDAIEAERLFKHIKRYKLRSKFDVRLVDEGEMKVWSIWEDSKPQLGEKWTAHTLGSRTSVNGGEIGCVDQRAPGMGRRVISHGDKKPVVDDGAEETSEAAYTIRRYLKGVAEGQGEIIREVALPQESNLDYMGGIDYRKGCYVGQELTIRTHHTGVVRKRILPVLLYSEGEDSPKSLEYDPVSRVQIPPHDTSIGRVNKKGRSAGKWITGVGNIGLGLCRLEIMTDVIVQSESSGYKEGDEFKIDWEAPDGLKTVRVKAFVPPWHLNR